MMSQKKRQKSDGTGYPGDVGVMVVEGDVIPQNPVQDDGRNVTEIELKVVSDDQPFTSFMANDSENRATWTSSGYSIEDGVISVYDGVDLKVPHNVVMDAETREVQAKIRRNEKKPKEPEIRQHLYGLVDYIISKVNLGFKKIQAGKAEYMAKMKNKILTRAEHNGLLQLAWDNYHANFPEREYALLQAAINNTFGIEGKKIPISLCVKLTRMDDMVKRYMTDGIKTLGGDVKQVTIPELNCAKELQEAIKNNQAAMDKKNKEFNWQFGKLFDDPLPDDHLIFENGQFSENNTDDRKVWWSKLSKEARDFFLTHPCEKTVEITDNFDFNTYYRKYLQRNRGDSVIEVVERLPQFKYRPATRDAWWLELPTQIQDLFLQYPASLVDHPKKDFEYTAANVKHDIEEFLEDEQVRCV